MPEPTDELAALEAALARLAPAPDRINIARLLFRAGQASVPRRGWAWPSATAASALAAAALGAVLLFRPVPPPAERVVPVYVRIPAPPAEPPVANQPSPPAAAPDVPAATEPPRDDSDYLQLRRDVLARGVDALPPPAPWPAGAKSQDLDTLLDIPLGARDPWSLRLKRSLQSGDAS